MRAIGIRFLISGFSNVGLTLLRKELDFKRVEVLGMVTQTISITTTIVCGLLLRSVWALVIGQLAQQSLATVGSYLVHPYRPSFHIHRERARALFHFGLNVTGSSILFFIRDSGPQAFLGKSLGTTQLGFYVLAFQLSILPVSCLSNVINSVTPSTYAKLQNDHARLSKALFSILSLVAALAIPASVGMCLLMRSFLLLYGPKYQAMAVCAQVLTLYGVLTALAETVAPFFLATGRPKLYLGFSFISCGLMVAAIYPLTHAWGITGTALAATVSIGGCAIWAFSRIWKIVGKEALLRWLGDLARIMASAAVMGAVVFALQLGGLCNDAFGFIMTVILGVAIYFATLYFVSPNTMADMRSLVAKTTV